MLKQVGGETTHLKNSRAKQLFDLIQKSEGNLFCFMNVGIVIVKSLIYGASWLLIDYTATVRHT